MLRLRAWRLRRGLTQAALGALLEVDQRQVARWERPTVVPRPTALAKLARVLDVTVDDLLTPDELSLPADDPTYRDERRAG